MDPSVKVRLCLKKEWLKRKAKEYGLSEVGTKLELATRVAEHEEAETERVWRSIINGGKEGRRDEEES